MSTVSKQGIPNLAPFAMVMLVHYQPPYLLVCFEEHTDSLKNVKETKEFVLNVPDKKMIDKLGICALPFPRNVNEFEKANLTPEKSLKVHPPSVKECHAHLECQKEKFFYLPSKQVLCLARVIALRGETAWRRASFAKQKKMLAPLYAFQPREGKVPFFSLGEFLSSL